MYHKQVTEQQAKLNLQLKFWKVQIYKLELRNIQGVSNDKINKSNSKLQDVI